MIIHTVSQGDSVYSIARRYGVPASSIIEANQLENPSALIVGQALVVPGELSAHTVARGESLYSIARNYNASVTALQGLNPQITNPANLQIGQTVIVPQAAPKLGTILVNGYAFPNIRNEVLQSTLPYLSYLSIFSYQVREDGSLKTIPDALLTEAARNANVAPMMVITNIEEGASFSSELAHTILNSEAIQDTLLDNVVAVLQEKNYSGLDVDFEYVYPEDRENYVNFMKKITDRLHPLGYTVTVALAPKTRADQPGLLYEAHDYAALGALVDHVILMTYEWGYTYGPPMAVSPLPEMRRVLDYAVTAIPSYKILMGMPNYGYDWTLPFVQGSAARSLSNTAAVEQARNVGAHIQFDSRSQTPFYYYYSSDGRRHVVWFDDARSIQAKLKLVDDYSLGGVSYWTINSFFPQNWQVLSSMYDVQKVL